MASLLRGPGKLPQTKLAYLSVVEIFQDVTPDELRVRSRITSQNGRPDLRQIRLRKSEERLEQTLCHEVPSQLAALLLRLRTQDGTDTIVTTHEALADHLGVYRETVTNRAEQYEEGRDRVDQPKARRNYRCRETRRTRPRFEVASVGVGRSVRPGPSTARMELASV